MKIKIDILIVGGGVYIGRRDRQCCRRANEADSGYKR